MNTSNLHAKHSPTLSKNKLTKTQKK